MSTSRLSQRNQPNNATEAERKIFVGGLSWATDEDSLKKYFENECNATVEKVIIMRDRYTGRSRGFGFVLFQDNYLIDRIINTSHSLDGNKIEAKRAISKERIDECNTRKLFVGGIPLTITEEMFLDYFKKFGEVSETQIVKDRSSGRSRGFGFVTFRNVDVMENVLQIPHKIHGKVVEVKRAEPKRPNVSFPENNESEASDSSNHQSVGYPIIFPYYPQYVSMYPYGSPPVSDTQFDPNMAYPQDYYSNTSPLDIASGHRMYNDEKKEQITGRKSLDENDFRNIPNVLAGISDNEENTSNESMFRKRSRSMGVDTMISPVNLAVGSQRNYYKNGSKYQQQNSIYSNHSEQQSLFSSPNKSPKGYRSSEESDQPLFQPNTQSLFGNHGMSSDNGRRSSFSNGLYSQQDPIYNSRDRKTGRDRASSASSILPMFSELTLDDVPETIGRRRNGSWSSSDFEVDHNDILQVINDPDPVIRNRSRTSSWSEPFNNRSFPSLF
eukprot:TRINITY_DN475_c0_g1_i1.p1 TRINITY_DN475_c0_g1~~TRINITY_DN475_c0_g1_i1.p1  ORF type:complete len:498 (-),score=100.61 TRINITY_DN475_c0_g1_i1:2147-3640(-)